MRLQIKFQYIKCKEEILLKVNKAMIFELNDFKTYFIFENIFPDNLNSVAVCYTLYYIIAIFINRKTGLFLYVLLSKNYTTGNSLVNGVDVQH